MISLHLRCRVQRDRRADFIQFLRSAVPYYEAPGGIRIRLLERSDSTGADLEFIEVVEYETESAFVADQERVANDPRMRALLAQWRSLLAEPPVVETYADIQPSSPSPA